ncbi:hypothetical protein COCC4DRAFT_72999 [Bipolaris maydis ATCC 48331]|uniref:Uncharacterized protein n=2 Tax=Cochliobolus heterostrophus TaxID=5016 RepID=M2U9J9_COCH5|nr:uncharacterized protein COCC4DRAFT_72999 [Bipolaris maydis ATCC 48331]EMD84637.1 hypothetical protein COCHEDRAFT_1208313 [Bipolaris maydis C5]KAJ5029489.1 hypothetical protein J3E73DRAFT_421381 [Bipolaris maydis]EMD97018.1 hypothetical protein COCHEDRAFT_1199824 [Bipolaris maydis C5]ENI04518.1 hypothetical protein COCC4DRAFT_72999 [Bipolaris maydis ATCC 48331]KAJ5061770.1 hypothetical protein J3E74DRAFT_473492 [Bipolaris maydis]
MCKLGQSYSDAYRLSQCPPGRSSALFTWAHEPLQPENPDQDCHGSPNISLDLDPVRPSFCLSVCLSVCSACLPACPSVHPSTHPPHPPTHPSAHLSLPAALGLAAGAGAGAGAPAVAVAVAVAAGAAAAAAAVAAAALLSPSCRCAAPRLASLYLSSPRLRLSKLPQAHHLPPRSLLPPPFPHPPCGTRHASAS